MLGKSPLHNARNSSGASLKVKTREELCFGVGATATDRNLANFLNKALTIKKEELSYVSGLRMEHEVSQYINARSWAEIVQGL